MNNKHLSWYKEINNNFIIASRAYFLQSPTCTRVNNLDYIVMILTPMESWCWSCFARERSLVNGSVTFRAVCILQIFYVYNALHGATLANCSHFQYVSRLILRVIQICVKTCIDVTFYDEPFVTSIIEKYFLIPLRIILTVVQWSIPRSLWRKYALEAIIKLSFISLYHDKCLLFMLELY